jgi:hypothetical protein
MRTLLCGLTILGCISVLADEPTFYPFGNPSYGRMSRAQLQKMRESVIVQGGSPTFAIVVRSQEDEERAPYWAWLIDASSGKLYRQSPADFAKAKSATTRHGA